MNSRFQTIPTVWALVVSLGRGRLVVRPDGADGLLAALHAWREGREISAPAQFAIEDKGFALCIRSGGWQLTVMRTQVEGLIYEIGQWVNRYAAQERVAV